MSFRHSLVLALATVVAGCQARIQHGLDERQANEIQTVLVGRGLRAQKVAEEGKKPTWAIEVEPEEATDAVRILAELRLPRPAVQGFSEVFGKGSLVPSPSEERALYLQALSGEVARTLETVDGVISARVHLVLPPAPRPGMPPPPESAKASAFLKVHPSARLKIADQKADLQALVAGSVETLEVRSVTLVVDEAVLSTQPSEPRSSLLRHLRRLVVGLGALVSLLALTLVVQTLRLRKVWNAGPSAAAKVARPALTATSRAA